MLFRFERNVKEDRLYDRIKKYLNNSQLEIRNLSSNKFARTKRNTDAVQKQDPQNVSFRTCEWHADDISSVIRGIVLVTWKSIVHVNLRRLDARTFCSRSEIRSCRRKPLSVHSVHWSFFQKIKSLNWMKNWNYIDLYSYFTIENNDIIISLLRNDLWSDIISFLFSFFFFYF